MFHRIWRRIYVILTFGNPVVQHAGRIQPAAWRIWDDGEQLLLADAARIERELAAAQAVKDEENARAKDLHERAEFERLTAKFGP